MDTIKKAIDILISEQDGHIKHCEESILALEEIQSRLNKNDIKARNSIRHAIMAIKNEQYRHLAEMNMYKRNVPDEIIEDLQYLYEIAKEDIKDSFEVFVEFTIRAYFRLMHPSTIDPKKASSIAEYLSTKERHMAQIYATNEILYDLYETLIDYGCDKDTARVLQGCISGHKRLPKEPKSSREEVEELGNEIIKKASKNDQ